MRRVTIRDVAAEAGVSIGTASKALNGQGKLRAETGWAAMTDSELAVARLVAQGLTNREVAEQLFVSPHTVDSHLRHIYSKLSINSRRELRNVLPADQRSGGPT